MDHSFIQLERVEFIVTYRCNSNCKHCLIQPNLHHNETMDPSSAVKYLQILNSNYPLNSINIFGGEPTLALETTLALIKQAKDLHIPHRQVLTNGNWGKNPALVAQKLRDAGVTHLEFSLDAFHQEFIPLQIVFESAKLAKQLLIPNITFSPRWIISPSFSNPMNQITAQLIETIKSEDFTVLEGEPIQPRGNARHNYASFFKPIDLTQENFCPYGSLNPDFRQIRSLCISPMGDVILCNNFILAQTTPDTLLSLLQKYTPEFYADIDAISKLGLEGLRSDLISRMIPLPKGPFYSVCDACFQYRKAAGLFKVCNA